METGLANIVPREPRIAAIVVTRNRLALLKECVDALRAQRRRPDGVIVVDNASNDGTSEWLAEQSDIHTIRQANLGGAGGFNAGIREAFQLGYDWFWCMDDDTIPSPRALQALIDSPAFSEPDTGFLASLVHWIDGQPHEMNVPATTNGKFWCNEVLKNRYVRIESASFVSLLVSRTAVARVGLPVREFFIWLDDVEFTTRICQYFKGYWVLDSTVVHKTTKNAGVPTGRISDADCLKYCYGLRNQLGILRLRKVPLRARLSIIRTTYQKHVRMILTGQAPPRVLWWLLKGLWFNPTIELVT